MIELLEKYPKAAKVVREYYLKKLVESLKADLPEEFKEHVRQQGVSNETIAGLLDGNSRALFDVFDENELFIDIDVHVYINSIKDTIDFTYKIPGVLDQGLTYNTRREAEKAAVEKAFELLEEKL